MKKIIIVIIGLVLLAGIIFFISRGSANWTENYDMDQELRVMGETDTIGDIIEQERARVEEHGYQQVCILGMTMVKGFLSDPMTKDEKTFMKIMDHICNEYK